MFRTLLCFVQFAGRGLAHALHAHTGLQLTLAGSCAATYQRDRVRLLDRLVSRSGSLTSVVPVQAPVNSLCSSAGQAEAAISTCRRYKLVHGQERAWRA